MRSFLQEFDAQTLDVLSILNINCKETFLLIYAAEKPDAENVHAGKVKFGH